MFEIHTCAKLYIHEKQKAYIFFPYDMMIVNMTDAVVNSWGVSSDSMVYLDSRLHIATYQAQLLTMEPVYLCDNDYLYSDAEDGDGDEEGDDSAAACPSAGVYDFTNLPLQLPSVPNRVYDWAATGWTGSATIDMYLDANKYQLIGRCQLNLVTHHSNSTSSSGQDSSISDAVMKMVPEAKATGMIIFGTLAALLFLCCVGSYWVGDEDDDDETVDMGFKRMDGENA
jgi:hypothetical protein